ncbi:MAG: hypothetical protein Q8R85_11480 [Bosea sp. (in: a-proteobacteria)]|uniref:hypothetical protein n=3 Tax=Bosea sp. (in: a-proteobacteria) TaxID=1871050 RepID=UPI002737047C|nr:hypothetical protein [Bosea sp. (in: a-proteobacteria)]MDP3601773.1 hypothetical protein [Bosea sp. (in: a-proteobacteria)]
MIPAALIASSTPPATMLRSPLLPAISEGLAAMPPADRLTIMVRLVSAMIVGVALCAARQPPGHPVRLCSQDITRAIPGLETRPGDCHIEHLVQLAEEIGARIWRLIAFQSDPSLRSDLSDLVSPLCRPAELVQVNPVPFAHA